MSKPDCDELFEKLYLLVDRELPEHELVELEIHIADCSHCLQRVSIERSFKAMIRKKCELESAPSELLERIRQRLQRESP
jgi:mycothiol system anti-sigma-R factor